MSNLLAQAIDCDDADRAAKMIRDALGIESDDVVNYCFPTQWPADREQRARRKLSAGQRFQRRNGRDRRRGVRLARNFHFPCDLAATTFASSATRAPLMKLLTGGNSDWSA
jgi:hypothetical protein